MENTKKTDVSALEILGACVLGAAISAVALVTYFYATGGF